MRRSFQHDFQQKGLVNSAKIRVFKHTSQQITSPSALKEYDRTVRELMSRVLGRSDDLDSPHSAAARPVRHVLEPVTMK